MLRWRWVNVLRFKKRAKIRLDEEEKNVRTDKQFVR